jgi:hypothetical protein
MRCPLDSVTGRWTEGAKNVLFEKEMLRMVTGCEPVTVIVSG